MQAIFHNQLFFTIRDSALRLFFCQFKPNSELQLNLYLIAQMGRDITVEMGYLSPLKMSVLISS